jgi:hypothetical protein
MGDGIRGVVARAAGRLAAVDRSEARRPQAGTLLAARTVEPNYQIVHDNLHAPAPRGHIPFIDIEREWMEMAPAAAPVAGGAQPGRLRCSLADPSASEGVGAPADRRGSA